MKETGEGKITSIVVPVQSSAVPVQREEYVGEGEGSLWKFVSKKGVMSKASIVDDIAKNLNLNKAPETIFGENSTEIISEALGITISFNAVDALSLCNLELLNKKLIEIEKAGVSDDPNTVNLKPTSVEVKAAKEWRDKKVASKNDDIQTMATTSDWTFSSPYKGFVSGPAKCRLSISTQPIPYDKLGPSNPILHFFDMFLFEDDLGDFGYAASRVRFRVMADSFFCLHRFYLRVDDVLLRSYDTRLYHQFGTNHILREFSAREASYSQVAQAGFKFAADPTVDQSDLVGPYLKVIYTVTEKLEFSPPASTPAEKKQTNS